MLVALSITSYIYRVINICEFLKILILIDFFNYYILAKDFSPNFVFRTMKLFKCVNNITLEGTVSPIFYS